jgi:hypothetical protein
MKRGKAASSDNLTLEHVIYSHPSVVLHLCRLFNLMLKHGYVPNQFGRGIIIPLVKDKHGDLTSSSNYRELLLALLYQRFFKAVFCCNMNLFCIVMICRWVSRKVWDVGLPC